MYVTWVMYFPGGGSPPAKDYAENDVIFCFYPEYCQNITTRFQGKLYLFDYQPGIADQRTETFDSDTTTTITTNGTIKSTNGTIKSTVKTTTIRNGSIYIVRKRRAYQPPLTPSGFVHPKDARRLDVSYPYKQNLELNATGLCELCLHFKYFWSYDTETYYSTIAALCGCVSIIVPRYPGQKIDKPPEPGIARGVVDIPRAERTLPQLRTYLECMQKRRKQDVVKFVRITQQWEENGFLTREPPTSQPTKQPTMTLEDARQLHEANLVEVRAKASAKEQQQPWNSS
jgi:hypothetical protein